MTEIVHVPLDDRAYDIHIGPGLLAQAGDLVGPFLHRPQVAVITDENVDTVVAEAGAGGRPRQLNLEI